MPESMTLGQFLHRENYGETFMRRHILPMAGAIWSSTPEQVAAYPLRAFGAGERGVGTWAYNVPRGTTWDDTETGVDYILVYDGKEDHPTNRALNPTGEVVVMKYMPGAHDPTSRVRRCIFSAGNWIRYISIP